jgi:ABC-type amino acid transport substrate-binding protein
MKQIRTFFGAMAASLLAASFATAGDWSTIRVGTEGAYPPFNYIGTDGELKGFDVEFAQALCAKMEAECTFTAQDWDGIIPALLAGKFDIIIGSMSITEERLKKVDFTDKYYATPARFIAPKDTTITSTGPEAMAGLTIGAQSSTTYAGYLQDNYPESDIRLYATQDEAMPISLQADLTLSWLTPWFFGIGPKMLKKVVAVHWSVKVTLSNGAQASAWPFARKTLI